MAQFTIVATLPGGKPQTITIEAKTRVDAERMAVQEFGSVPGMQAVATHEGGQPIYTPAAIAIHGQQQPASGGQQPGGGPPYNPNPGAAALPTGIGAPVNPISPGNQQLIGSIQGQPGTPQMPSLSPGTFGEETFGGAFQRALAGMGIDPTKSYFGAQINRNTPLQGQLESTLSARRGLGLDQNIAGAPENRQLEATLMSRGVPGNFGQIALQAIQRLQQGNVPGAAGGYANPTNDDELNDLAQLALAASRAKLGGYFSSRLLPSAGALSQQFANQSMEDQSGGFLPYLQRRLAGAF